MKIIASDYDGTINCGGVSQADREAIAKFRKAGNKFGVNTGRDLEMATWILYDMKDEIDFLICCTGGTILDGQGNIIFEKRQKSEARFEGVVTLQSQTTKVNAQWTTTNGLLSIYLRILDVAVKSQEGLVTELGFAPLSHFS
jgi:hydroxymethylpyrimidine pyrophosphatase-like HAD family hydrolase